MLSWLRKAWSGSTFMPLFCCCRKSEICNKESFVVREKAKGEKKSTHLPVDLNELPVDLVHVAKDAVVWKEGHFADELELIRQRREVSETFRVQHLKKVSMRGNEGGEAIDAKEKSKRDCV